jgi:hypothetical protein
VRFEVFKAVSVKTAFWDDLPCSLAYNFCFGETCCRHLQVTRDVKISCNGGEHENILFSELWRLVMETTRFSPNLVYTKKYSTAQHPRTLQLSKETYIFQTYPRDRNREFIGVILLLVHNMFRPLRAIFRWNTISLLIYLEKAIDITTDPLFHNLSLIIYLYNGKWAFYFKMNWL